MSDYLKSKVELKKKKYGNRDRDTRALDKLYSN